MAKEKPKEPSVRQRISQICRRLVSLDAEKKRLKAEDTKLRLELADILNPDINEGLGNRCVYYGFSFTRSVRKDWQHTLSVTDYDGNIKTMREHLNAMKQLEIAEGAAVLTGETPIITMRKATKEEK